MVGCYLISISAKNNIAEFIFTTDNFYCNIFENNIGGQMPIYTYECEDCGEIFDCLVFKSTEKPKCSSCGSSNLKKLPTSFGVRMGDSGSGGSCPTGTCPISR